MIFKIIQENKLIGFSYYPILEIIVGVFLLIMSFLVPLLFFKYNGFKVQQWDEWLMAIAFFIFFFLLGKNLTFQSLKVEIKNNRIYLSQDMRLPAINLDLDIADWEGYSSFTKEEKNEKMHFFVIKTKTGTFEFYQTRNDNEILQITNMLSLLYKENKGEDNGTK